MEVEPRRNCPFPKPESRSSLHSTFLPGGGSSSFSLSLALRGFENRGIPSIAQPNQIINHGFTVLRNGQGTFAADRALSLTELASRWIYAGFALTVERLYRDGRSRPGAAGSSVYAGDGGHRDVKT